MAIVIREVESKIERKKFINFQFEIYKNDRMWVPSIISDEIKSIDPDRNPAFNSCKAKFWLAYNGNMIVGRIGAIINLRYNEEHNEKLGRFSRFESIEDINIAKALLETASNWLKDNSMTKVMGPLGFNNLDQQGLLIEGYDYLPSIGSAYHKPYYKSFFEELGWEKEIDWVEFRLTLGEEAQNKAMRGSELIKKRYNIEVKHFKSKRELAPFAKKIFEIINESFDVLPFVSSFDKDLIDFYAKKYISFLNPHFVKMTLINGEPIGFIVAMPSLSKAMQMAKGKLFPFGIFYLLNARKGNGNTVDQMLTGVINEYHSTGAAVILQAEMQAEMLKHGIKYIETTGIFETNDRAIKNWKNYEHIQHKRRRCYRKELN
ncbi:MAG: hypothetical protein AUJ98_02645 [Bacteroidetes bacterium CG2_30_33_31]|nr:MAG: hypothetical protein AUJ98_02645 [Bacteroidetes bacterium CG2_30_33_31]